MDAEKMRKKAWCLFVIKYLDTKKSWPDWADTLDDLGCILLDYWNIQEDTDENIFIRDPLIGNILVPRNVATKILVLGQIP